MGIERLTNLGRRGTCCAFTVFGVFLGAMLRSHGSPHYHHVGLNGTGTSARDVRRDRAPASDVGPTSDIQLSDVQKDWTKRRYR